MCLCLNCNLLLEQSRGGLWGGGFGCVLMALEFELGFELIIELGWGIR